MTDDPVGVVVSVLYAHPVFGPCGISLGFFCAGRLSAFYALLHLSTDLRGEATHMRILPARIYPLATSRVDHLSHALPGFAKDSNPTAQESIRAQKIISLVAPDHHPLFALLSGAQTSAGT